VKRKRAQPNEYSPRQPLLAPASPAPTLSSVSSGSPGVSPSKEAQPSSRRPPSIASPQSTSASPQFKAESLVPSSSLALTMDSSCTTGTCTDPPTGIGALALGFDNQGLNMFMNMGFQAPSSQDSHQDQLQQLMQQQALMEQLALAQSAAANNYTPHQNLHTGDLMNHSLFDEEMPARRVISNEELPWSELYNLFDTVPLPMPLDDDPDEDMDSNPSPAGTPTADNDNDNDTLSVSLDGATVGTPTAGTTTASVVTAGAPSSSAILHYL